MCNPWLLCELQVSLNSGVKSDDLLWIDSVDSCIKT